MTPGGGPLGALRDAPWLTAARARAWCRILAVVTLAVVGGWIALSHGGLDPSGKPLGTDFLSFWTASRLALGGPAASAYDPAAHAAAQQALFPTAQPGYYAFFYPPVFLLLCLPLGFLPYLPALVAWLASGFAAMAALLRRMLPDRWAVLPVLVFPGVLVNAGHGQNGFLSASCFGGFTLLLQRRPALAGACLGALVFKPHLLLAAPVALLAARRWSVVAGAACSALGLVALSWLVLGGDAWRAFLAAAPLARATLEQGLVEPWKMPSAFAAVRVLGGGLGLAYAAQLVVALGVCAVLARAAARRPGGQAEGALLVAAALLCSPFLLDYDLVCLAVPLAFVAASAQRTGWRPWEKITLLLAYVLPMLSRPLAMSGAPVGPLVLAALLAVMARRAGAPGPQPGPGQKASAMAWSKP